MRALAVSTVLVLGLASPAHAEDTLTLEQIIHVAVRQSPDFARAKLDRVSASGTLEAASGIEDTHIGAVASVEATNHIPVSAFDYSRSIAITGGVVLRRLFSTGALVSIGVETTHLDATYSPPAPAIYTSAATVSITQPLLRGFGASGTEAAIRDAAHIVDATRLAEAAKGRDTVVAITQAYWGVALAWRELEVRKSSLELAEKQLTLTEAAIRADKIAKSESLAIQQVIAIRQQDVIAAEQLVYERSLALRQLAGLDIDARQLGVQTEPLPKVEAAALDLEATVKATFEHSAELAGLREQIAAAKANVDGAESAARSRLDLAVNAGPQGTSSTFRGSFSEAVKLNDYAATASLTFDHALERRIENGNLALANARLQRAKIEDRAARARIAATATRAVQRAKAALASVALGEKAITLAQQNLEAEQHRFELAKSTNFDIIRRQDELETARLRLVSSTVDYFNARADLDGLTGDILTRWGITFEP